jgi:hypothetical protein
VLCHKQAPLCTPRMLVWYSMWQAASLQHPHTACCSAGGAAPVLCHRTDTTLHAPDAGAGGSITLLTACQGLPDIVHVQVCMVNVYSVISGNKTLILAAWGQQSHVGCLRGCWRLVYHSSCGRMRMPVHA